MPGDYQNSGNHDPRAGDGRFLYRASYGDGGFSGAGKMPPERFNEDAGTGADRLIDGDVLLEIEHLLLRCAPELMHFTAEIRVHGLSDTAHETLPVGFNRYRVCLPPEARREILNALRSAAPRCGIESMHHVFRLIAIWESLCKD